MKNNGADCMSFYETPSVKTIKNALQQLLKGIFNIVIT